MRKHSYSSHLLLVDAVLAVALLGGCGADAVEATDLDGEVESVEIGIKNGQVLPSAAPVNGVARLYIWSYDKKKWATCTGQVSSRNTIITAAHCFDDSQFSGEYEAAWPLYAKVQTGPNTWKMISPNGSQSSASVYLHPGYWTDSEKTSHDATYDFAVIHTVSRWHHTTNADTSIVLKAAPSSITAWGLGYGQYDDGSPIDNKLRGAQFSVTATNNMYEYQVGSSSDPQVCPGDSGGPLKLPTSGGSIMLGVAAIITGGDDDDCGHSTASWARTDKGWPWLLDNIDSYSGDRCTNASSYFLCW